ncbi:MAG: DNA replication/repair protein RecF [Anaerolineaceae bacterium]
MHLTHLSLTNFRAFSRLDMDIPRRVLLLAGDNAQGKTSLLEAIYFLATFTSFHAQSDRQLINFLASSESLAVTRIVADYERDSRKHRLEVRLIQEAVGPSSVRLRKEILLDGVKKQAADAVGHFNAVIFLPQMTRILENGPEERRRYLNLTLAQALPGFAQLISDYQHGITQRNALLKLLGERSGDPDQLAYWDELIAKNGAAIIHARIQALDEIERLAGRIMQKLTHGAEVLRMLYQPAYDPLPKQEGQYALPLQTSISRKRLTVEQIRQGFLEALSGVRQEEIARGVTTIGPHRDEVRFLSNGIDLSDYGSRGQVRSALLALKLAEIAWLKEKTGQWPVLLLDETLAELDEQRRADLIDTLEGVDQAILTTTDADFFPKDFRQKSSTWVVKAGVVTAAV